MQESSVAFGWNISILCGENTVPHAVGLLFPDVTENRALRKCHKSRESSYWIIKQKATLIRDIMALAFLSGLTY